MADDTTVVLEPGFEPEPIPDSIADTELFGIEPADESTDEPAEDTEQEATEQEQPEPQAEEPGTPTEDTNTQPPEQGQPEQEQEVDQKEIARQMYEQRQAHKQQQDFVTEQRQQIRQYQAELDQKTQMGQLDDLELIKEQQRVIQANQYMDTVERNRMSVVADANRALNEIPFFKSATPQAQAAFQQAVETFNDAYAVTDPDTNEFVGAVDRNGNPVSLYNYMQQQASIYEQIAAVNQRQGQQAEAKMRAKAVNPSNLGKVTSTSDDLDDLLDKIGDVDLTRMG